MISEISYVLQIVPKSFGLAFENINRIVWIVLLFIILSNDYTELFLIGNSSILRADLYILINLVISLISTSISNVFIQFRNDSLEKLSRKLKIIGSWNIDEKTIENELLGNQLIGLKHVNRTIMFGDIRGFTKFSEGNHINQVVKILQGLYDEVESVSKKFNGSKPEFIADEFILFFDSTEDAIKCGLELSKKLCIFLNQFGLGVGIGIDKGNVVEGIVGSKSSKKYTAFGMAVNTASRLQSNAEKEQILISRSVLEAIEGIEAEEITGITMKGVSTNFQVFALINHKPKRLNLRQNIMKRLQFFK
jgi:class 3 adenylate cyclase